MMGGSERGALLDEGDYPGAMATWQREFAGREGSLEATWELAGIEERWGDALFFDGKAGSTAHYQAAQRALVPPGASFSSGTENGRRMDAYGRLTHKLYATGPDGTARPEHDARPHPEFKPIGKRQPAAPSPAANPPVKSGAERQQDLLRTRQTRERTKTEVGQLSNDGDHWRHHDLGELWLDAARELAQRHPHIALRACEWSLHFFELYHNAWTAHLPASRWDTDGCAEMAHVQELISSLATGGEESQPPAWVSLLIDGELQKAVSAFDGGAPEPAFQTLANLLRP